MTDIKHYTFRDNTSHTISALIKEEQPAPTGDNVKIYVKQNGVWVPLFTE